jgi:hypothetical protein
MGNPLEIGRVTIAVVSKQGAWHEKERSLQGLCMKVGINMPAIIKMNDQHDAISQAVTPYGCINSSFSRPDLRICRSTLFDNFALSGQMIVSCFLALVTPV